MLPLDDFLCFEKDEWVGYELSWIADVGFTTRVGFFMC
jgi:hypothetical protein